MGKPDFFRRCKYPWVVAVIIASSILLLLGVSLLVAVYALHVNTNPSSGSNNNNNNNNNPSNLESNIQKTLLAREPATFPPKIFGCATSAYQIEGAWNEDGKGTSIWDDYVHRPDNPVGNGDTGDVACDHYHKYKSDVQLFKQLGVNVYSFTIAWTRILPNGRGPLNQKGLDFYVNLAQELVNNGIKPMCTLYHWDLPSPLYAEYKGWTNRTIVDDFAA
ncbi:hypothetical protein HDU76_008483, partial [Blyttiomyces sp. JEL0837]